MAPAKYARKSPAVAFVGRHNSGKTTFLEKLIRCLTERGLNVGTVKHHGHPDFDIDIPGKDSWRHRQAGSRDTVIVSSKRMARVTELDAEPECDEVVAMMPGHDIVLVEGYRKSGLPTIEIMRQANERDLPAAEEFCAKGSIKDDIPVAVISDIEAVHEAAAERGIPAFGLEDIEATADFVEARFVRPRVTVTVQAGGESRRMGRSKATVPFLGRPLIERVVGRVAPAADEVLVTTNEPENLQLLYDEDFGVPVRLVTDVFDRRGALQGFFTALTHASHPTMALVACDMVFASARLISAEAGLLRQSDADAVVPVTRHGMEPFHGVYRRDTCLEAVRDALDKGLMSMHDCLSTLDVREVGRDEVQQIVPQGKCFINVNTPDELKAVEEEVKRAREIERTWEADAFS
jgi:molybdopterin-guanine dinucleotide biosynthesis protein MobB